MTPEQIRYSTDMVGALLHLGPNREWHQDNSLLGTAFPISENPPVFLSAKHCMPEDPHSVGVGITQNGTEVRASVIGVGGYPGQPDVAVLVTDVGVPAVARMAYDAPQVMDDVWTVGFCEDTIVRDHPIPGNDVISIRGLKGHVTRWVDEGLDLNVHGPSLEISFAIPSGVSGGPLVQQPRFGGGLVGICLGNIETTYTLWHEEIESADNTRSELHGQRITQYGRAARFWDNRHEQIEILGMSISELMGTAIINE